MIDTLDCVIQEGVRIIPEEAGDSSVVYEVPLTLIRELIQELRAQGYDMPDTFEQKDRLYLNFTHGNIKIVCATVH